MNLQFTALALATLLWFLFVVMVIFFIMQGAWMLLHAIATAMVTKSHAPTIPATDDPVE